jgi:predicted RNase H-like nuclease (RuvC/YqgF family)
VNEQEVKEREEKRQEDVSVWRQGVSFSNNSEHVIDDLTATITMLYINLEDANKRIEGLIASNERLEEKHRCECMSNKWLTTQHNNYEKTTRGLGDTIKKLNAKLDLVYQ